MTRQHTCFTYEAPHTEEHTAVQLSLISVLLGFLLQPVTKFTTMIIKSFKAPQIHLTQRKLFFLTGKHLNVSCFFSFFFLFFKESTSKERKHMLWLAFVIQLTKKLIHCLDRPLSMKQLNFWGEIKCLIQHMICIGYDLLGTQRIQNNFKVSRLESLWRLSKGIFKKSTQLLLLPNIT